MPDTLLARCRELIREVPHGADCPVTIEGLHRKCCESCCGREGRIAAGLAGALEAAQCGDCRAPKEHINDGIAAFREAAGEGKP